MKKTNRLIIFLFLAGVSGKSLGQASYSLELDGAKTYQTIDGFGINANTRSWRGEELKPAVDLLLDSLHSNVWRVILETVEKWEDVNDNNDPFNFNWGYYDSLYETPKFQRAWGMIRYLNERGITRHLMLNFMGPIPLWMGGEKVDPAFEDEYVEMLVSLFYYASVKKHLSFGLISIMNEPDIHKEGPTVGPDQYARLLKKVMTRMKQLGLGGIRFVAPDVAGMENGVGAYIPVLMKDSSVMAGIAHVGLHSYAGYYANVDSALQASAYPETSYWITEWNEWGDGLDDGKIGVYDYNFSRKCMGYLIDLLNHGATAAIQWEGYDSYYEHHAPSTFSYWGVLGFDPLTNKYAPRKNFYALQQLFRFVNPGATRILVTDPQKKLPVTGFKDSTGRVSLIGINPFDHPLKLTLHLQHLNGIRQLSMYHTNATEDFRRDAELPVSNNADEFIADIPANSIFTLTGKTAPDPVWGSGSGLGLGSRSGSEAGSGAAALVRPEPAGWYTGDIHVHKNCGDGTGIVDVKSLHQLMEPNDLSVISVLADMGNGEVKFSQRDLPRVTGKDAPETTPGRIVHWDAEWHWDATYSNFGHQALGGHLVLLGLTEAHQIWDESPYKILDWARKQGGVSGFAHFEYLNDSSQQELNCCIPVEYPVEAALGTIDFVSEDVYGTGSANNGNYHSEAAIQAYYKLLNCGFRLGLAAGTDFPCNDSEPLGTLLTYVNLKGKPLSYAEWISGIKNGRTVVSRNGHQEFLDFTVENQFQPGDEIRLKKPKTVRCSVTWSGARELSGRIELVCNGKVFATEQASVRPGQPVTFTTTCPLSQSSWLCARRMDTNGHAVHTAPVYIAIHGKPIRGSAADARFFVRWMDSLLAKTAPGGEWSRYFTHDQETVRGRYEQARAIFQKISQEAEKH